MSDTRHRNREWNLGVTVNTAATWDQVKAAVLMDIRDELVRLNAVLQCQDFQRIPTLLRLTERNTRKRAKPALKIAKRRTA